TPEVGGQNGCILVFTDDCGVGDRLASRLTEIGRDVISIRPGAGFQKLSEGLYELDPGDSQDYDLLLEDLGNAGKVPANLIHLWSVTPADNASVESAIDRSQELGFYSLLSFVQAFGRKDSANLFIAVVSNNLQEVSGDETLSPEKATVLGPVKVIPQEYPNIKCRSIDIVSTADARLIDQLLAEISSDSPDQVVAYRGSHRWVQIFEPVRLDESSAQSARIVDGGVYLITGGLGGVGLTLAEHLARTAQAKLALIGRSKLPPPLEWDAWLESHPADDGISEKIRKVRELEAMGSEVVVIDANVADREQIERAISETMGSFGKINGVIHSAGVPAGGVIQLKTREMVEAIVAPKLTGTLMLDSALKGVDLDFFLLCSSLASVVGGAGQVDYCGANAFLDVFARRRATSGHGLTVSVNWDAWQEVGMAAEAARENNGMGGAGIGSIAGSKKANHPMFDYRIDGGPGREVFVSVFSAEKHWFLSDHKVTGTATLPGTAYLEMARAALQEHAGESALEIRDAYFLAPLMVAEGEEKEARTVLSKIGEHFEFSIASRTRGDGDSWQEHAKGEIAPIENPPHRSLNVREIEARCGEERRTLKDPELKSHEGFMEFGPRWNNVQRVRYGNGEGIATLELPEPLADDVLSFKLHPALLDSATGFLTIKAQDNRPYLPFSYKRLTQKGPLPEKVYSYARFVDDGGSQHGTLKLDVTITDSEGTALVEIEDYILRKIDIQRVSAEANAPADWDRKNFDLSLSSPGVLDSLRYVPVERHSPGPGQVEIKVCATALNFKEVLMALGLLGIPTGAGSAFGLECAGKIVSVGKGVSEFEIGDEVIAFARSSFSPYVITSTTWVARKPASLSFEEAATIPVPFLTAYFSLINAGRLNRGERVLIHAAAGGVGLAAVQVAKWAGAEIFATAGNDEKRRFLQSLGIEHVMDSRSLTFAEEVMRRTGGEGVNVVLNSLTGEFIAKGLSVLAPYGRFLEIGKRDIYSDAQLGLRVFDKCLVFAAIDISPDTTPGLNSSWAEIARHLNDGVFQPLPHTVFAIDEVSQAFDLMARAGHIGRIVVSLQDEQALKRFIASDAGEDGAGARRWRAASAGKSRVGPGREGRVRSRGIEGQPMDAFAEGILPSEGAIAFNRILSASHPQIIVSPRNFLDFSIKRPIPGKADIAQGVSGYRPSHPRPGLKNDYVAPRNETERLVAEIWQNLLGIEQVGVYDNFFELGGDSLLAAQVIPRLHETFGVNIAVARMFEEPTAAGLAELVSSARWSALSTEPDEPEDDREEGRI
ncbi:MAG TPA: SDR family NAD(P)-dependent oxidoreductase, partial [Blastocatellia bacterium]|nr:SDR family NAD(P)-dependent oxidoreductase [Blastocatellia bacterium]